MSSAMNAALKAMHDKLLAEKPEGAVHDPQSCPVCAISEEPGEDTMTTFTEDEVTAKIDAAVAAAVAERDAKIAELTGAVQNSETAQAVAEVKAELEPKIAELQAALDKAMIEAANTAAERDAITAWLEAEKVASEAAAEAAARKDDRLTKVKEAANFPQEYLDKNAERFAAMSDEDFTAALESWAALSDKKPEGDAIPPQTGLHAGRDGAGSQRSGYSATKDLLAMRRERGHVDLTTL